MSHNADAIIPGLLFQGNYHSSQDRFWLSSQGIRAVVNVAAEAGGPALPELDYFHVEIEDRSRCAPVLSTFLDAVVTFIHGHVSNGRPVLVHCVAGRSRSGAVVTAYLKWSMKLTARKAFSHLLTRRPLAQPKDAFLRVVDQWQPSIQPDDNDNDADDVDNKHDVSIYCCLFQRTGAHRSPALTISPFSCMRASVSRSIVSSIITLVPV